MEYSSNKLSNLSGVSPRALRHYDGIGLLKPARVAPSGYRMYGPDEVSRLQQILLYKELGFSLADIKKLLEAPDYDREQTFLRHLTELHKKRERLDTLIENVTKSIAATRGEQNMTDKEKFEGFKQTLLDENEQIYGEELRDKYGTQAMEESGAHLKGLTQAQYEKSEQLRCDLEETLKAALSAGDPAGELAQQACDLHRQWLCVFYPNYSKAYHLGLGEMYVADARFRAYYDKIAPGCTEFLRDAIQVYCKS
ncbi:MAG: MerR family transcriptional regulator [Oscillospiraceae bacterium]|nr:MerR family transcriptional regulator [Oscillospiraceae bacterium]